MAVKSGNLMAGARGLRQVLALSSGQRLKVEVLEGLVEALEAAQGPSPGPASSQQQQEANVAQQEEEGEDDDLGAFTLPEGATPLVSEAGMPELGVGGGQDASSAAETRQEQADAAEARSRKQLMSAVGTVLKEAVNASCCTPEVTERKSEMNARTASVVCVDMTDQRTPRRRCGGCLAVGTACRASTRPARRRF